jgi:hypothetical protein
MNLDRRLASLDRRIARNLLADGLRDLIRFEAMHEVEQEALWEGKHETFDAWAIKRLQKGSLEWYRDRQRDGDFFEGMDVERLMKIADGPAWLMRQLPEQREKVAQAMRDAKAQDVRQQALDLNCSQPPYINATAGERQ